MNDSNTLEKHTFDEGLRCAECVLSCVTQEHGVESELILGIASGFCHGMSNTCHMCGAVTGGILSLNIMYAQKNDLNLKQENYQAVQALINDFEKAYGTTNCMELLDCDLGSKEGQETFDNKKLHMRCREYVGKAAELVSKIIKDSSL